MLKKYYKKINKQKNHQKLRKQYNNFCDTVINIDGIKFYITGYHLFLQQQKNLMIADI